MCTAITYKTKDFYFGRTLDNECSFGEQITITPRNYPFKFHYIDNIKSHYAIIGMSLIADNYPLYFDAINENGLGMAGLNFVGNAFYSEPMSNRKNVAQFEFIPYILSQCRTVNDAKEKLSNINITNTDFSNEFQCAKLHWIISDANEAITVEAMKDGIHIYNNTIGVLTNNPPFEQQMFMLNNYMGLSSKQPKNLFSSEVKLNIYSKGMGAIGLPGDLSSASRFVRASFTKMNSISGESENESVSQFFHILGSVNQQRGCCEVREGEYEITEYTSCCNVTKGIYYYTTYNNHQINAVDMHKVDLNSSELICYPLIRTQNINFQN